MASPATLPELLEHLTAARGDEVFLRARGAVRTAGEFAAEARTIATALGELSVRAGDRVLVHLEKCPEKAAAVFACGLLGAVSVVVNPRLKDAQVRHVVLDAEPRVVLQSPDKLAGLLDPAATFAGVPLLSTGRLPSGAQGPALEVRSLDEWRSAAGRAPAVEPVAVAPSDPATIHYTSGSTGLAKGIVQSHRSLCDGARIVAGYLGLSARDRILAVLPLSFDYGLNQLLSAAHAGCEIVLQQYLSAAEVLRALADLQCTGLAGVPETWIDFCAALRRGAGARPEDLCALRYVTNTGGRLPLAVIDAFTELLPHVAVFSMYGLTEAFRSSYLPPEELRRRPRSIGRALPGVELLVVDPDTGAPCAPGQVGELVHCGALVADGYWRRPQDTARVFRPHPVKGPAGGTAVYSGDLVRADGDGFLEFVGRRDFLIKVAGHRVSPDEVLAIVARVPGVARAAVVGRELADGRQQIVAAIVPATGGGAEADVVVERARAACRRDLPSYMVPAEIRAVAELPRNANQKVDLAAVRRMFAEPESGAGAGAGADDHRPTESSDA